MRKDKSVNWSEIRLSILFRILSEVRIYLRVRTIVRIINFRKGLNKF